MGKDDWNEGYKFAMERDCSNLRDEIAKLQAERDALRKLFSNYPAGKHTGEHAIPRKALDAIKEVE